MLVVVGLEQVKGQVELVERAQAEQVHLEQVKGFDALLVPLDHGAASHGGVLDGHDVVHRLVAQEESAGMDGEVAGHVLDLVGQPEQVAMHGVRRIQAGVLERRGIEGPVVRRHPGQPVQRGLGHAQHLAHVAHGRAAAVAHHVGHHGRVGPAVLAIHVLDHLLAPAVLDVQIDVGRLGPLAGNEALEEEPHLHRVHGRDAQAVAHRGVGGRAAALAEDLLPEAELDDLPHGEEVAVVIQLVDESQLPVELGAHGRRDIPAKSLPGALEGERPEPGAGGGAVRELLRGVAVAKLVQGEGALLGHDPALPQGRGIVGKEPGHLRGRTQVVLGIGAKQAAGRGQPHLVPEAGEHVLEIPAGTVVVEHLHPGHHGQLVARGPLPEAGLHADLVRPTVPHGQGQEPVAECLLQEAGRKEGFGLAREQALVPAPERHQPLGVLAPPRPR